MWKEKASRYTHLPSFSLDPLALLVYALPLLLFSFLLSLLLLTLPMMTLGATEMESLVLKLVDLAVAEGWILLEGVARVFYVDNFLRFSNSAVKTSCSSDAIEKIKVSETSRLHFCLSAVLSPIKNFGLPVLSSLSLSSVSVQSSRKIDTMTSPEPHDHWLSQIRAIFLYIGFCQIQSNWTVQGW